MAGCEMHDMKKDAWRHDCTCEESPTVCGACGGVGVHRVDNDVKRGICQPCRRRHASAPGIGRDGKGMPNPHVRHAKNADLIRQLRAGQVQLVTDALCAMREQERNVAILDFEQAVCGHERYESYLEQVKEGLA